MISFKTEKISTFITRIYGPGGEQMYLIEGKVRAALVDCGCGVGQLGEFIKSLTDLPVTVLITHGHVDHALGISQFEDVYMCHLDMPVLLEYYEKDAREWYLSTRPNICQVEKEDYVVLDPKETEKLKDIKDGDVFDLGGITIEAVLCGGHSPGSVMFLIREARLLITGDACCFFTMLHGDTCLPIETYEKNLVHARNRLNGRFDDTIASHTRIKPDGKVLDEVIELCRSIMLGTDEKIETASLGVNCRVAKSFGNNGVSGYARTDGKYGNIVYNPDNIWENRS